MGKTSAFSASAENITTPAIRVASVPAGHVYVCHLSDPSDRDGVVRLTDPVPPTDHGKTLLTGQRWPR